MRQETVITLLAAATLGGCAADPELLNSERIQSRFGSYGIDILFQDTTLRYSSLFSTEQEVATTRTYAIVEFDPAGAELTGDTHETILGGASIGATLSSSGYRISKRTLYTGTFRVASGDREVLRLMHLPGNTDLAVHIYELNVETASGQQRYAVITEAHHPDYLVADQLRDAFPVDPASASQLQQRLQRIPLR